MVDYEFDYYYERQTHHRRVLMVEENSCFVHQYIFRISSILDVKLAMGNEIEPVNNTHWKPSGLA